MIKIRSIYTVGQLNSYIKNMFKQDYLLQSLSVKGEVSNVKYHPSGHIYFTMKDPRGAIDCIMFAGNRGGLSFRLEQGQQVVVTGSVDVYEKTGDYQLYARQIELDGNGELYLKFEQLKKELEEMGMFAPEYKKPIPAHVRTLGVVTARSGAAIRDIIQVSKRRNPYVQIILYPAIVQGEAAVPSIVQGIRALEALGVDAMIVGRGGGSIEDLWAFNERAVAEAVFQCSVPIISAVGHETDTTIIDFVSDLRAPTPSAAAEQAVEDISETLSRLFSYQEMLHRLMDHKLRESKREASAREKQLTALSPSRQLQDKRMRALHAEERLERGMEEKLRTKRNLLALYVERMKGVSPLEKLNSGYSYVADEAGRNIRSVKQVSLDQEIGIRVRDGEIKAKVLEVKAEGAYAKR